jgi:hypothetical protein
VLAVEGHNSGICADGTSDPGTTARVGQIIGTGRFAHCQIGIRTATLRTSEVAMSPSPDQQPGAVAARPAGDPAEGPALAWLNEILWPDGDGAFVPGGDAGSAVWWANPSVVAAQTLMPAAPGAAARRAVRRYHDGQSLSRRARSVAAELALMTGPLARHLPLGEVVGVTAGALDRGVIGRLRAELDPQLTVAVSLAQAKSNRKPVLQLLAPDGRCVRFAKVASTAHTEALVANEAAWLARPASLPLATPELVWHGPLAGREVVVMSAVVPPRLPRRAPTTPPPQAVFVPVGDCGWWRRVADAVEVATPDEAAMMNAVAERWGTTPVLVGAFHGDLAPWNLFTTRTRYHLIDWEFAADDVPVGLDRCHFHLQAGNETLGLAAPLALARARQQAGVSEVVWDLYCVELLRRQLHLRSLGYPEAGITHGPAALADLRARLQPPHVHVGPGRSSSQEIHS